MLRRRLAALATRTIDLAVADGAEVPREFRLFKAGENDTTKGVFVFDEKAADMVMARAAERGGVDYPIDLEHLSLDDDGRHFDPDARGWFKLAVRNGELWAVDVRWTPDGARRLSERTQRYVSPAFMTDDDGRVTEIVNVALVAMPATHGTPALVAAGRRPNMKIKDRLRAQLSIAKGKIVALADGDAEAKAPGKFAAVQAAAKKCEECCAALESVSGVDEGMNATAACMSSMEELEKAIAALTGAPSDDPVAPAPDAAAKLAEGAAAAEDDKQKMARAEAQVVTLRAELAKRDEEAKAAKLAAEHEAKVTKLAAEQTERRSLVAELVKLGRETPATAWADDSATMPRGSLGTMPLSELRDRVKAFGGVALTRGDVLPPPVGGGSGVEYAGANVQISEYEVKCVTRAATEQRRVLTLSGRGAEARSDEDAVARYTAHKEQQARFARDQRHDLLARFAGRVEEKSVLLRADGRTMVKLANATPIESFGASSQRALEQFRLEFNMALAAAPRMWAEEAGFMLPGGSLKDTYPINFNDTHYVESVATSAAAKKAQNADITVVKRKFRNAKQANLKRLLSGDFAYVMSWLQNAQMMADARVFLRNELVTSLLEAGTSGYWGQSTALPTGIDGMPYFSATHAVNPFDTSQALRGVTTWSNYQAGATPLNSANLTAEKATAAQVASPSGREFGYRYDQILTPTIMEETARNLLSVQDIILDAKTPLNSVTNTFGGVKNPHYNSGTTYTGAPELAGTSATASDYYLVSRAAVARGLYPWIIAEDAAEEVILWDETSDFYKNGEHDIKYESVIYVNAALLFPQSIRKVKGS